MLILQELVTIFAVAVVVVAVLQRFGVPSIAGFIIAGAIVGPNALGLITDVHQVEILAEAGHELERESLVAVGIYGPDDLFDMPHRVDLAVGIARGEKPQQLGAACFVEHDSDDSLDLANLRPTEAQTTTQTHQTEQLDLSGRTQLRWLVLISRHDRDGKPNHIPCQARIANEES